MNDNDWREEYLAKYEIDELLDLFFSMGYTVTDFVDRHPEEFRKLKEAEDSDR